MKKIFRIQLLMVALFSLAACNAFSQDKFGGLTLYTVRSEMEANPEKTIKEVADIGYKYIESAGYQDGKFYGMSPEDFKNYLAGLDLVPISTHQGSVTLENAEEMIADVKAAGFKYFVIPVPPMGHFKYDPKTQSMSMSEDIELVAEILTTLGKKCKEAGLELLYHNHDFEFKKNKKGIVPIEYFLENLDPAYVNFQIDLYWTAKAGADPVAYFEKYPGRFKIWHVKDMDEQGRFTPVGTGTIDFAKILEKKELSGMQYYIVEQDRTFDDMDPLEAIRISHDGLKKFGFQ
ncbi:MAG: sugar phosphate isomerase/epimerase [Bacteroidales bacterium]|nr:sugar phosphate isomerase/epimerase [Bacteroidales bacterium]